MEASDFSVQHSNAVLREGAAHNAWLDADNAVRYAAQKWAEYRAEFTVDGEDYAAATLLHFLKLGIPFNEPPQSLPLKEKVLKLIRTRTVCRERYRLAKKDRERLEAGWPSHLR